MRNNDQETRRPVVRKLSFGVVVTLVVALVAAGQVLDAQPAEAATVNVNVQAQMANQSGWTSENGVANPRSGDCIRYGVATNGVTTGNAPNSAGGASNGTAAAQYTDGNTALIGSGTPTGSGRTAYTAHGNNNCSTVANNGSGGGVSLGSQSALGFSPSAVTSVATGAIFNLGRMVHLNNPINATNEWFRGDMNIKVAGLDLSYRWRMHETANDFAAGDPRNDDILDFLNQISDKTVTIDGLKFSLVVLGFTPPQGANSSCTATLPDLGTVTNTFRTPESTSTYGCLYASLQQVRTLTIVKQAATPYGPPAAYPSFNFTSSSNLAGSPWGNAFSLQPTASGVGGQVSVTRDFVVGQTVNVGETLPSAPWSFTSLQCVDGAGAAIGTVSGQSVKFTGDISTNNAAAVPITCTYVNTYTPRATLTLKKNVITTGQPGDVASPFNWTLTAAPNAISGQNPVSGTGQLVQNGSATNPAITNASVIAGTYSLSETPDGVRTSGYVQDGPWACYLTANPTQSVPVVNGTVALTNGQNVTCAVTNRFQTGTLQITKTVTGAGYTGGVSKDFTARYVCSPGNVTGTVTLRPNAINGQAGATVSVQNLPAGASCAVTEINPPTGTSDNLTNTSWVWVAPVNPASAIIPVNGSVLVNIGNSTIQQLGSLQIGKSVLARDGTPAAGYTGGGARAFPVQYTCSLGGQTVSSGTVNVTPQTNATIPGIPATAVCSISGETLDLQAADFADASYRWDGYSASPATVTIPAGGTGSLGITNRFVRELVDLTLTKTVTGAGYTGTTADFTVTYDCGTVEGSVDLTNGGSQTVKVPAGVQCAVAETPLPSGTLLTPGYVWGAPTYTGLTNGTVTVPVGQSATVAVTNPNSIGFGRLSVTKAIANYSGAVANATPFTIRVTCDAPAQGQTDNYSNDFTVTWPNPATRVTAYLPIGSSCTVSETSLPTGSANLADGSYAWLPAPADQIVVVPASVTPSLVTVTNDIQRVNGAFSIQKAVINNTGATVLDDFAGTWSCTYAPDSVTQSGSWTAPAAGGAATLNPGGGTFVDVLVGSVCTVTESAPAAPGGDTSYVWTQSVPGNTTVPAAGAAATVTNTLNRTTGSFSVSKSVSGGAAGTAFIDGDFTFDYVCTPQTGPAIAGVLTMPSGGAASPAETIPAGSSCVVTETGTPDAIEPFTWDGVTFAVSVTPTASDAISVTFPIPEGGGAVSVNATNIISKKTVNVTVSKAIEDPDGGLTDAGKAFPVVLVCDGAPLDKKDLTVGASQTWAVDLGSSCRAVEDQITGGLKDASFAWGAAQYAPDSVTVDDVDGTYEITVTNPIERVYGTIGLQKMLDDGGFPNVVDAETVYSGTWTCTYPGDEPVTGTWESMAGATATLTGDFERILLASSCSATETDLDPPSTDPSFTWAPVEISPVDTVSADATSNVIDVTNTLTRATGSLDVRKLLTGETAGYAPTDDFAGFAIGVTCTYPGQGSLQEQVDVQAGDTAIPLINGVPAGWTCTVNEAPPSGLDPTQLRDPSFAWGDISYAIDDVSTTSVLVQEGTIHQVVVTNDIARVVGGLIVTKAITTPDAVADGAIFAGDYTCTYREGLEGEETFTGTWQREGAGAATLTGDTEFPLTSECSVTEQTLEQASLVDTSWQWALPQISEPSAVDSTTQPATALVTNAATRVWAGLEIEKEYVGDASALPSGLEVGGTWSCTYNGAIAASGRWTLLASGGSTTVVSPADAVVPAESDCAVQEDSLSDSVLVDGSYAWNEPALTPEGGTLTVGPNETGTISILNSTRRVATGFQISKNMVPGANVTDQSLNQNLTFSGAYSCTYGTDAPVTGIWGPIANNGVTTVADILVGSTCAVTSEDRAAQPVAGDDSFAWLPADLGAEVTAPAAGGELPLITVINPVIRQVGSFSVAKTVAGDTSGLVDGSEFPFEWQCIAANGDLYPGAEPGAFAIAADGVWAAPENVPSGSTCTVTELAPPAPSDPSYTWSTSLTIDGAEGEATGSSLTFTTPSDGTPLVTATNTLTRTVGSYAVTKTSDPATGSTVVPGQTITYTVTVTPAEIGFVDDVIVTDDLSEVNPSAIVQPASITVSQGTTALLGDTLTWDLARVGAGEPLTLTYEAVVKNNAFGVTIANVITVTGEIPPTSCDPCSTNQFTPAWTLDKSSDPVSGSSVMPRDTVTYTLTARNTSQATVSGATAVDDLSNVLDSATLVEPLDGSLSTTGTTLTWTIPELAPDASAAVSYAVLVADDTYGATLTNVVVPEGPGGSCTEDCTTVHYVPSWSLDKSSDPASSNMVTPGMTVTYTLTASNTGGVIVSGATASDDLSAVLNHATVDGALPDGLTLEGTTLTWAIADIPVDGTQSISYRVRVKADAYDVTLRNVVTPTTPGGTCENCTTTHTTPPPLPVTGGDIAWGAGIGGGMLLLAGLVLLLRRRRVEA